MKTWGIRRRRRDPGGVVGRIRRGFLAALLLGGGAGLLWALAELPGSGGEGDDGAGEEPARALEAEDGPELRGTDAGGGEEAGVPGRAPADARIRVEVLNAGGVPGAAAAVRDELRERGFDVVYWGNAEAFDREETVVLDRADRMEWARRVAAGLAAERVRSEPDPDRLLEVTVLVGSSWEPPDEETAAEEEAPASLRRWLEGLTGF